MFFKIHDATRHANLVLFDIQQNDECRGTMTNHSDIPEDPYQQT